MAIANASNLVETTNSDEENVHKLLLLNDKKNIIHIERYVHHKTK